MKRTIRIDSIRISGVDGPSARALPGALEASVRRQLEQMPTTSAPPAHARARGQTPVTHVAIDHTTGATSDRVAAAVAEAIGSAVRRGGPR